jgi:hypothetical protein
MLYLHWVTFFPGKWLTEPERAGFLSMSDELSGFMWIAAHTARESGYAFPHHNYG